MEDAGIEPDTHVESRVTEPARKSPSSHPQVDETQGSQQVAVGDTPEKRPLPAHKPTTSGRSECHTCVKRIPASLRPLVAGWAQLTPTQKRRVLRAWREALRESGSEGEPGGA